MFHVSLNQRRPKLCRSFPTGPVLGFVRLTQIYYITKQWFVNAYFAILLHTASIFCFFSRWKVLKGFWFVCIHHKVFNIAVIIYTFYLLIPALSTVIFLQFHQKHSSKFLFRFLIYQQDMPAGAKSCVPFVILPQNCRLHPSRLKILPPCAVLSGPVFPLRSLCTKDPGAFSLFRQSTAPAAISGYWRGGR